MQRAIPLSALLPAAAGIHPPDHSRKNFRPGCQDACMRQSVFQSFVLIAGMAVALNVLVYLGLDGILWVLRVPEELILLMKEYLRIIFLGITATLKSTGQSTRCRPETNQKRMHPLTGSIRFFIEHQIFSASMACCRCW